MWLLVEKMAFHLDNTEKGAGMSIITQSSITIFITKSLIKLE